MEKIKFAFLFFILVLPLSLFFNFGAKNFSDNLIYERKVYFSIQSFQNDKAFERYLGFLKNNKISGITFYGLHKKLEVSPSVIFAKLKNEIPEIQIFIAGDNFDFFNTLNEDKNLMQYVDGFHIEYEYWNYYKYKKKDRNDAFNYFIEESKKIKILTNENKKKFEAYFGWFNDEEAKSFLPFFDSILLHSYTNQIQKTGQYIFERLLTLSKIDSQIPWFILCSAEKDFMEQTLKEYGLFNLEKLILENIKPSFDYLKNFKGFYWFTGELVEKAIR
jgi:hypothetical protein